MPNPSEIRLKFDIERQTMFGIDNLPIRFRWHVVVVHDPGGQDTSEDEYNPGGVIDFPMPDPANPKLDYDLAEIASIVRAKFAPHGDPLADCVNL